MVERTVLLQFYKVLSLKTEFALVAVHGCVGASTGGHAYPGPTQRDEALPGGHSTGCWGAYGWVALQQPAAGAGRQGGQPGQKGRGVSVLRPWLGHPRLAAQYWPAYCCRPMDALEARYWLTWGPASTIHQTKVPMNYQKVLRLVINFRYYRSINNDWKCVCKICCRSTTVF